jgi:hypothetical protein
MTLMEKTIACETIFKVKSTSLIYNLNKFLGLLGAEIAKIPTCVRKL